MKQKIVIKVQMACDKCRSKAMALTAATDGVDSVGLAGDARDQVVVVGEGVDSIKLTSALRRKVGPAQLVQVAEAKDEKKPPAAGPVPEYPWIHPPWQPVSVVYDHPAAGYAYGYGYQTRPDSTCSIM